MSMDLPIDIITMDSLMKRWSMSFMDIVLAVVNHDLTPVYKNYPNSDWEKIDDQDHDQDILGPFYDPKADPSKIAFFKSDVEKIEAKFDRHVSKSTDIIHEDDLAERFGISKIELWNLQDTLAIDIFDPFGIRINEPEGLKSIPVLMPGEGYVEYYFKLTDVEELENK